MDRLRDDQRRAVRWMMEMEASFQAPGGILAEDVGKGKTFMVAALLREAPLWPTLVVAPKATLWDWIDVLRDMDVPAFPHALTKHAHASDSAMADLVVTTHSMFARRDVHPDLRTRTWGRVIVDEAHIIRNVDTLLHKALAALKAHAKWALSATPLQNGGNDLLALARFIGVGAGNLDAIRDAYLYRASTCKTEVKSIIETVRIPLAVPGERELYESVEAAASDGGQHRCAVLERMLRCRQAATHPAIYHRSVACKDGVSVEDELVNLEEARRWDAMSSSKLDHLLDDIKGHDEKALVFCDWIEEMDIVKRGLENHGIECATYDGKLSLAERQDVLARFRSELRVLLIQIQCGGCGLNLQAASRVYMMRPQWNPAIEHQAIGRAARSGQRRTVIVQRLVAVDTVDDVMSERQRDKLRVIAKIMRDDSMIRTLWPENDLDEQEENVHVRAPSASGSD